MTAQGSIVGISVADAGDQRAEDRKPNGGRARMGSLVHHIGGDSPAFPAPARNVTSVSASLSAYAAVPE